MKISAVLVVEDVAKSLAFWVDRMAFQKTVEVPEGDRIAFAILEKDGSELMLQSLASVQKDEPKFAQPGHASLFIEVDDRAEMLSSSRSLNPKAFLASSYSPTSEQRNIAGSSVCNVIGTPASKRRRTGCSSTRLTTPVTRLLVMQISSGMSRSRKWRMSPS